MMIDTKNVSNVQVAGIDMSDYPKFCDAYIESADINGVPATEAELETLNQDYDFVYQSITEAIY